jgi:hypothetical protein
MTTKNKTSFAIGNGASRAGFDLSLLSGFGATYGCNLLFTEYVQDEIYLVPSYTIAIEDYRKDQIRATWYPSHRCIFPPDIEQYEELEYARELIDNDEYDGPTARNNAGMLAMKYAIKHGATTLFCLGMDFIIEGPLATSNMFEGAPETRCSFEDSRRRVFYLDWFCRQNPDVDFHFVLPDGNCQLRQPPNATNFYTTHYNKLGRAIHAVTEIL